MAAAGSKRRRNGDLEPDLKRVAEIVMALAAAGEMRGGKEPTAAEKALATEARERLAVVCEGAVRPKDLFPREAVCAVVEDLGLNRSKDPAAIGFRPPPKVSISEKLLLTKRKMEEFKDIPMHPSSYSSQNPPKMSGASADFPGLHGAPRYSAGVPGTPPVIACLPASSLMPSSSPAMKQPRLNETHAGVSTMKPASTPVVALPHTDTAHRRFDARANGPAYLAQSGATLGQSNKSLHDNTSTRSHLNAVQSSNQVNRNQEIKTPAVQAVTGNLLMGHQASQVPAFVHPQHIFTNHNDIAKNVQQLLHQVTNHPSWTPPSTEYMKTPLSCQVCKAVILDVDSLLVCDACEKGSHLKCLQTYGGKGIPKAEWHCPTCLMLSHGKPLPPKYGKVTRTIIPPKSAAPAGSTQSSLERAAENPPSEDNHQKVAANGNLPVPKSTIAGSTVHNIGVLVLNTRTMGSEEQASSKSTTKKENVKHVETLSNHTKGDKPLCSSTGPQDVKSPKQTQSGGLPTCNSTGSQCVKSPGRTQSRESPACTVNSSGDFMPQSTTIQGTASSDHSCGVAHGKTDKSETPSRSYTDSEMEITNSMRTPEDQKHVANGATVHENSAGTDIMLDHGKVKEPSNGEVSENNAGTNQATPNGVLYAKDEVVGCNAAQHTVDWVGDALKVVDGNTYYATCHIDGRQYKLQDHVLISSRGSKFVPSKLLSLCEERESGSKLAIVEPYLLSSDVPGSVSRPFAAEDNEVYASNNQKTTMLCSISGPCEVLPADKFREESKRRSQLVNSDGSLHPIFFCRWKYDESKSSFDSFTN